MRVARIGALVSLSFALAAVTAPAATSADQYVALGDSFSSGVGTGSYTLSSSCRRGVFAYPWLVYQQRPDTTLTFVACSGARTSDVMASQIQSVTDATNIVTLTIGGNDIGFSEVAQSCIVVNPFSHPCLDKYNAGGVNQLKARIDATAPKVAAVLQGIKARAPSAKIYVVNYPAIFPETGFGCWPQMPLGFQDVPYLRTTQKQLNSMLAAQAAANGATLVNWYAASIGHDACKGSSTRWVEPLVPGNSAAPIHPNKAGMVGGANALLAAGA